MVVLDYGAGGGAGDGEHNEWKLGYLDEPVVTNLQQNQLEHCAGQ